MNLYQKLNSEQKSLRMMYKKGFTLIELLVVVLIIGVLAAVALPQYQAAALKSRSAGLVSVMRTVKEAEDLFYIANGHYTDDLEELDIDLPAGGTIASDSHFAIIADYPNGIRFSVNIREDAHIRGTETKNSLIFAVRFNHAEGDYPPGEWHCGSYGGNKTADQVCKSMGGIYLENQTYRLPW